MQEEDLPLLQAEDPLLIQEDDLLLAPGKDPLLVQGGDLLVDRETRFSPYKKKGSFSHKAMLGHQHDTNGQLEQIGH